MRVLLVIDRFHFPSEIILGQLLQTFSDFFLVTPALTINKMLHARIINLDTSVAHSSALRYHLEAPGSNLAEARNSTKKENMLISKAIESKAIKLQTSRKYSNGSLYGACSMTRPMTCVARCQTTSRPNSNKRYLKIATAVFMLKMLFSKKVTSYF